MATMLAYIFTDADFDAPTLDRLLHHAVETSFNMLSIDTDTSTSDTCVLLANGLAGRVDEEPFSNALTAGCMRMAEMLARDGEGATKLIRARVTGAASADEARRVARSIVNSPLIKTMAHGADPNVGRVLMAIGKCFDCTIRPDATTASINGTVVVQGGRRADFDEPVVRKALANDTIDIDIDLGVGDGAAIAWGCDLTAGYVEENAAYYSS
jgi:glutamate N-acetyltransferase/amino-acid N-acetyltransferase